MESTWDKIWEAAGLEPREGPDQINCDSNIADQVWELFFLIEELQNSLPSRINKIPYIGLETAKLRLSWIMIRGLGLMKMLGLPGARLSTEVKFYQFSTPTELLQPLRSTLSDAYRAWANDNYKDLGVRFELFVVVTFTLFENLAGSSEGAIQFFTNEMKKVRV